MQQCLPHAVFTYLGVLTFPDRQQGAGHPNSPDTPCHSTATHHRHGLQGGAQREGHLLVRKQVHHHETPGGHRQVAEATAIQGVCADGQGLNMENASE